jgi:hypothetical protein
MPSRFVFVRASLSSSPTVTSSSPTNRLQLRYIAIDTSHGPYPELCFVVRCGILCSNSLSNSMVNATSAWESKVGNGRSPLLIPADASIRFFEGTNRIRLTRRSSHVNSAGYRTGSCSNSLIPNPYTLIFLADYFFSPATREIEKQKARLAIPQPGLFV